MVTFSLTIGIDNLYVNFVRISCPMSLVPKKPTHLWVVSIVEPVFIYSEDENALTKHTDNAHVKLCQTELSGKYCCTYYSEFKFLLIFGTCLENEIQL